MSLISEKADQASRYIAPTRSRSRSHSLKSNHQSGISPAMEAKIATLEVEMAGVRAGLDKLAGVPVEIATLRGDLKVTDAKVEALPTKDWIATRLQVYVGIMAAISAIAVAATKFL